MGKGTGSTGGGRGARVGGQRPNIIRRIAARIRGAVRRVGGRR